MGCKNSTETRPQSSSPKTQSNPSSPNTPRAVATPRTAKQSTVAAKRGSVVKGNAGATHVSVRRDTVGTPRGGSRRQQTTLNEMLSQKGVSSKEVGEAARNPNASPIIPGTPRTPNVAGGARVAGANRRSSTSSSRSRSPFDGQQVMPVMEYEYEWERVNRRSTSISPSTTPTTTTAELPFAAANKDDTSDTPPSADSQQPESRDAVTKGRLVIPKLRIDTASPHSPSTSCTGDGGELSGACAGTPFSRFFLNTPSAAGGSESGSPAGTPLSGILTSGRKHRDAQDMVLERSWGGKDRGFQYIGRDQDAVKLVPSRLRKRQSVVQLPAEGDTEQPTSSTTAEGMTPPAAASENAQRRVSWTPRPTA